MFSLPLSSLGQANEVICSLMADNVKLNATKQAHFPENKIISGLKK